MFHYACALYHDLLGGANAQDADQGEAGFIIIVDRRQDSWAAANVTLQKIQVSYCIVYLALKLLNALPNES